MIPSFLLPFLPVSICKIHDYCGAIASKLACNNGIILWLPLTSPDFIPVESYQAQKPKMKAKSTYTIKMLISVLRLICACHTACQILCTDRQILCMLLCIETSAEMLQYLQKSFKVLNNTAN